MEWTVSLTVVLDGVNNFWKDDVEITMPKRNKVEMNSQIHIKIPKRKSVSMTWWVFDQNCSVLEWKGIYIVFILNCTVQLFLVIYIKVLIGFVCCIYMWFLITPVSNMSSNTCYSFDLSYIQVIYKTPLYTNHIYVSYIYTICETPVCSNHIIYH